MGKKTREKLIKRELEETKYKNFLTISSQALNSIKKEKKSTNMVEVFHDYLEEYQSHFIKDLHNFSFKTKSKDLDKQFQEIIRHVFHKYSVPSFMYKAWLLKEGHNALSKNKQKTDFKNWYVCIATGGSLYKEYFKEFLTKKETHLFLNCKHNLEINEAITYSIAKAENDNEGLALRIARSKISSKAITDKNPFWRNCIRFFAKHTPASINDIDDLVDYLEEKYRENNNYNIMGQGFTLKSLTKKMHDWHYDLRRMQAIGNEVWSGIDLDDKEYIRQDEFGNTQIWKFHQIKSSKELQREGNAQRHCVFSYKQSCIEGYCSIWSLTCTDSLGHTSRKLTIELSKDFTIVQARGIANRSPKPHETAILEQWAVDNNLYYKRYKFRY